MHKWNGGDGGSAGASSVTFSPLDGSAANIRSISITKCGAVRALCINNTDRQLLARLAKVANTDSGHAPLYSHTVTTPRGQLSIRTAPQDKSHTNAPSSLLLNTIPPSIYRISACLLNRVVHSLGEHRRDLAPGAHPPEGLVDL